MNIQNEMNMDVEGEREKEREKERDKSIKFANQDQVIKFQSSSVPKKRAPSTKEKLDQTILEQNIMLREFKKILDLAEKQPQQLIEFKKLKYQDHIYNLGDSLMIATVKDGQKIEQVGLLKRIVSVQSFEPSKGELPLIVVHWYCNRDDMPIQYVDYAGCFSVYELFLTELSSTLFVDSIIEQVKVLDYTKYEEQLGSTDERVYFMRSGYNTQQELLVPHPKDWPKSCICGLPPNPDLTYIFCESCQGWMHMVCAKVSEEESHKIDVYVCKKCREG